VRGAASQPPTDEKKEDDQQEEVNQHGANHGVLGIDEARVSMGKRMPRSSGEM
jgi:hypothetical protein